MNSITGKSRRLRAVLALLVSTQVGRALDPLATWTWRNPVPPPTISKFAFGVGQFVGVGSYGTIVTSTDGVSWVARNSGTHLHFKAITFGNGLFVATASGDVSVGVGSAILTSTDGVNWIQRWSGGTPYYFPAIAYGDGQFVAVGDDGAILSSRDGIDWARQETGDSLRAIAYGNGKFTMLGNNTNGPIVISFDGVRWVELRSGTEQPVNAIAYGNGQFVGQNALGDLVTSVDGATWVDTGTQLLPAEIGYANGLFIASDDDLNTNTLAISTNGVNWVYRTSSARVFVSGLAYGNGQFVAQGEKCDSGDCTGFTVNSLDGVNWVPARQSEVQSQFGAIAYGGGQFVAVGYGGTIMTSTDDGVTWVSRDSGLTNSYFSGIAYGIGQFAAFSEDYDYSASHQTGSTILTSADGVNWVERWSGGAIFLRGIAYGNGLFAVLGQTFDGLVTLLTSTDGVNWAQSSQVPFGQGIAYGDGKFVIVGDGIMTSTDAVDWRQTYSGPFPCVNCGLSAVAYGNGRFVALGSFFSPTNQTGYQIGLTSPDGLNWVMQQSPPPTDSIFLPAPPAIAYGNGQFVVAGFFDFDLSHGGIQTSRDGWTWGPLQVIAPWEFYGVTFGNGRFVAVGGGGEILQSGPNINLSLIPNGRTGPLSLSLEGPTGVNYTIQSSTDLIAWHDLMKITNAASDIVITNLPAPFDREFYRARSQ